MEKGAITLSAHGWLPLRYVATQLWWFYGMRTGIPIAESWLTRGGRGVKRYGVRTDHIAFRKQVIIEFPDLNYR